MSGGVDSSVCAAIASEVGVECAGATMKLFGNELLGVPVNSPCCSLEDVDDAKSVCHKLGIVHYTINCKREFMDHVISPFYKSYTSGQTPNPCIACNRYLKFDTLLNKAHQMGFSLVLTGHYACVEKRSGRYYLRHGSDIKKDQSYVLHTLTQDQLKYIDFPLYHLDKRQVRDIAEKFKLPVAQKKESQDICFIPDGDVRSFLRRYEDFNGYMKNPCDSVVMGKIVDVDGKVLGTHIDISGYTIGQRKGLGVAVGEPVYVVDIDISSNTIVVGPRKLLIKDKIIASDFNWIYPPKKLGTKFKCTAKIRYNMKDIPCKVRVLSETSISVKFRDGISAPAKGQSIVLYDGDYVIGGGYIAEVL